MGNVLMVACFAMDLIDSSIFCSILSVTWRSIEIIDMFLYCHCSFKPSFVELHTARICCV